MSVTDHWGVLGPKATSALLAAAAHCDGMTLTGVRTARLLVKRGLAESYGSGRICITEHGLEQARRLVYEVGADE